MGLKRQKAGGISHLHLFSPQMVCIFPLHRLDCLRLYLSPAEKVDSSNWAKKEDLMCESSEGNDVSYKESTQREQLLSLRHLPTFVDLLAF